jgi:hypothetical protein
MNEPVQYTYRSVSTLTKSLMFLLGVGAMMDVFSGISSGMEWALLSRPFSEEEATANDLRESCIGLIQLLVYVATAITFCVWIVRSHKNARAMGAQDMSITPGWAAGFFFVPVVNLWKPYQAMVDLWRASYNPAEWAVAPTPQLLNVWWGLWLTSAAVGQVLFKFATKAESIPDLLLVARFGVGAALLDTACSVAALLVVRQIGEYQRQWETAGLEADATA